MGSESTSIFSPVLIFLLVPFLCAFILRRFKIPPIIGYIIGGIFLGSIFRGLPDNEVVSRFADFGILLLLFTTGLEVNFEKLLILKRYILIGGTLQIGLSTVIIAFLSLFFNFSPVQAALIGMAFASSSTVLVAKIIQDKGEESSFLGELALGILAFQDLFFIPFVIIFTHLNAPDVSYLQLAGDIMLTTFQTIIILIAMYFIGRRVVPLVFDRVARTSRELLNLMIVIFIFFIAYLSSVFEVPALIGMFIAGVLVGQTMEHHHIFSQIRPLRDLLSIIFFVYIGSHINNILILSVLPQIIIFVLLIMLAKAFIIMAIFLYMGFNSRMVFSLGAFLFQLSENAFILMSMSHINGLINDQQYQFIITATLISLMLTPLVITNKDQLYQSLRTFLKRFLPPLHTFIKYKVDFRQSPIDAFEIKKHVVICGYGRVGSYIGRALTLANIPFIAIDYNFHTVDKAKKEGINIIFGDPTDIDILDFAQTEHAAALISVIPERYSQEMIVLNAKKLNPNIVLITRVHTHAYQQRMKDLGVDVVVQPEFEASLSIIKKIFILNHLPQDEMLNKIRHFKVEQGIT